MYYINQFTKEFIQLISLNGSLTLYITLSSNVEMNA